MVSLIGWWNIRLGVVQYRLERGGRSPICNQHPCLPERFTQNFTCLETWWQPTVLYLYNVSHCWYVRGLNGLTSNCMELFCAGRILETDETIDKLLGAHGGTFLVVESGLTCIKKWYAGLCNLMDTFYHLLIYIRTLEVFTD